VAVEKKV